MNSLEACIMNNLLLLKLEVAMELKRRGVVSINEFERLIAEEIQKVCSNHQGDVRNYMLYFLDIIDIRDGKAVLSRDGKHYIEVIKALRAIS